MGEKRTPHHSLAQIQSLFSSPSRLKMTTSAFRGAATIGYDQTDIVRVIQTIQRSHFYKSMTSYDHPTSWQDVYHVPDDGMVLYVKFTDNAVSTMLLLSFKEA